MTPVFLFGTLRDDDLRACVLGAEIPAQRATLPDYAVTDSGDISQPLLTAHAGAQAEGLVLALDDTTLARVDLYEGLFGYARAPVPVMTPTGLQSAQIYRPTAPQITGPQITGTQIAGTQIAGTQIPGTQLWSLPDWQARYAVPTRHAAAEVFALSLFHTPDVLRVRYPMLLAHAASQTRAAAQVPAQAHRRAMVAGDVVSRQTMQPYSYFFAVQVDDLQFRRFDGTLSPVVRRAGFVMADAVTVLPYDPVRDCVMLIEQFRYGLFVRGAPNCWVLEPIAGRIDPGEGPRDAALREMQEEARLDLSDADLVPIGGSYPSPGAISEYLFHFIALCDLPDSRTGVAGLASEAEDIRSHILPFDAAMNLITTGEAQNGPLIQSLYWLALNRDRVRASING